MPIPGGEITTTEIWNTPAQLEDADIPFEKTEPEEVEQEVKEEE